jgi:hypothetical protein
MDMTTTKAQPKRCPKIEAHRVYGELTKCWNCGRVLEPTGKGIGWKHV